MGRPRALDARGHGIRRLAVHVRVEPAEALVLDLARLGLGAQCARIAIARGPCRRCGRRRSRCGFLVIHRHPREGFAHLPAVASGSGWPFHALGIHVDQPICTAASGFSIVSGFITSE